MDKKQGHTAKQVNEYLDSLNALKYSPKSILTYKRALDRFISFLTAKNINRIHDVTLKDLDTYRLELINGNYADHSISLYLRSVRSFFRYLEETQHIFMNPSKSIIIPRIVFELKPVPTEEEVKCLLDQPDVSTHTGLRDRAIIETFYSTGTRLNELVGMNHDDMDLGQADRGGWHNFYINYFYLDLNRGGRHNFYINLFYLDLNRGGEF